jgi:hypothetical protein
MQPSSSLTEFKEFQMVPLDEAPKQAPVVLQQETPPKKEVSTAAKVLVTLDHVFDCIPLGSTASNLVNLGLKHIVFSHVDPKDSSFEPYLVHLQEKKTTTCLAYGLPVLGNVLKIGVGITKLVSPQSNQEPSKTNPILEQNKGNDDLFFQKVTI